MLFQLVLFKCTLDSCLKSNPGQTKYNMLSKIASKSYGAIEIWKQTHILLMT